ncbi:cation:proton antiporter [Bdellovibrio reynosensis]|uniref:Cation:proton antiporter n=1 Tax=Bdellovibrio reynosensis TaxID=2835041 RepID=A0ABY4CAJ5_9BACT|nr:cation:proton antiporter [Bdellovibrio reynosensis]UOF01947.1 cation:proton antiporter [Bdellovibrio reynosensis]
MLHLPHLITDLGIILIIAGLATLLFKRLGQPLVLGYLIAGFLVSQHVPFFPTVTDAESIKVWSEIGVIFLLFSLGLEFSFKKLFKVGGSAGFTAVFEVIFMVGLGYAVGRALGWNSIDSLFFGGILSISSTTIIVRAFHELGLRKQKFVELVFGILVVEDIVAILLLVLLAAIAQAGVVSGSELLFSGVRLLFFIALWFLVGIFLIPIFLRKIRKMLEDETTLLVALGLCFAMVIIAANLGFSAALGAFIMGSLLAETPEGHKMENLLQPVKNLFAAIFFVSVGMMIDPKVLGQYWGLILLVTFVTIVGKFISTYLGALISGQSRKTSFQSGMSLAQIGEFSFIIASLGVSLKVTSDFLYPVAIAVSAVTTFTTPYLIKFAEPLNNWVDGKLPQGFKEKLDNYQTSFNRPHQKGMISLMTKAYGPKILVNTVMVIAVIAAFKGMVIGEVQAFLQESSWAGSISLILCLLVAGPFLWGIVMASPSLDEQRKIEEVKNLKVLQAGLFVFRMILALGLVAALLSQFVTLKVATGVILAFGLVILLFGHSLLAKLYRNIEKNFLKNLTEKERHELALSESGKSFLPWQAGLGSFEITPESHAAGKSLREQAFKEKYGVSVAAVFRGKKRFFAPSGDFVLFPYDKVICFGSEDELQKFHGILEDERSKNHHTDDLRQEDFTLSPVKVEANSPFIDKSIRECDLRHVVQGLIVGVERGHTRILGPSGGFILQENDVLWVVSEHK